MATHGRSKRLRLEEEEPLSSLPSDVLHLVLSRLDLRDHVRLGVTCKSMQQFTMHLHPPSSKPVGLVGMDCDPTKLLYCFLDHWPSKYSLRRRCCHRDVPLRCVGFHKGWLVTENIHDRSRALHVCNRVLRSRIRLPPRRKLYSIRKVLLSSEPGSDDCLVAALHDFNKVAICRPGIDRSWVVLDVEDEGYITDMVFVGDNLLVLCSDVVYTIGMNVDPPTLKRSHLTNPMYSGCHFLIEIKGRLLLLALLRPVGRSGHIINIALQELRTGDPVGTKDLGGGAVLVCLSRAAYVPPSELGPLRGGCVYFMDGGYRHVQRFGDHAKKMKDEDEEGKAWNLPFFRMFCIDI